MPFRKRPRLLTAMGFGTYLFAGLTVTGLDGAPLALRDEPCPAPLLDGANSSGEPVLRVLQGNAWMLPSRPLLLPRDFSTDRRERLERLVGTIRSCRPEVVLLEEVFEADLVRLLERSLPEYDVFTSGETDFTGTVNASGLVTLARVPVDRVEFRPFRSLPADAQAIERLGRKGFLSVTVDAPGFRGNLVNVHLYAYRDAQEERLTRAQLGELLRWVRSEEAAGRWSLVGGDFNLERDDAAAVVAPRWRVSEHGPTYDPPGNPYTVTGSNDRPEKHAERAEGRNVRTIDYLLNTEPERLRVRSGVLDQLPLSDHYFLEHRVTLTGQ